MLVATFLINHFDLFGLRQVYLYFAGQPYTPIKFERHSSISTCGIPCILPVSSSRSGQRRRQPAATAPGIRAGDDRLQMMAIQFEERDLVDSIGEPYRSTAAAVPMILPIPKKHRPGDTD